MLHGHGHKPYWRWLTYKDDMLVQQMHYEWHLHLDVLYQIRDNFIKAQVDLFANAEIILSIMFLPDRVGLKH